MPHTVLDERPRRSAQRLVGAVALLVLLDVVGGLVAISDGVNRGMQAWGSTARLAAPWPMVLVQVAATAVAITARRAVARPAAALLSVLCLVSAVSGFFDGGLGAPGLLRRHVALQVVLVCWTALVGVLALQHARRAGGRT
jgi:hypothetical protein